MYGIIVHTVYRQSFLVWSIHHTFLTILWVLHGLLETEPLSFFGMVYTSCGEGTYIVHKAPLVQIKQAVPKDPFVSSLWQNILIRTPNIICSFLTDLRFVIFIQLAQTCRRLCDLFHVLQYNFPCLVLICKRCLIKF
jgi:hypothetical protein